MNGKRGRPPQDVAKLAQSQIDAFQDSQEDDETFFGNRAKAHKAFLKRLLGLIMSRCQTTTDPAELQKLTIIHKQLTVVVDMLVQFGSTGIYDKRFAEAFDAKLEYMEMPPQGTPAFMYRMRHTHKAEAAHPNGTDLSIKSFSLFWCSLSSKVMAKHGYNPEGEETQTARIKLACGLLLVILQRAKSTTESVAIEVIVYSDAFQESMRSLCEDWQRLPEQIDDLKVLGISASPSHPAPLYPTIEQAILHCEDTYCPLLHTLRQWPTGRAIVRAALERGEAIRKISKLFEKAITQATTFLSASQSGVSDITGLNEFFESFINHLFD